MSDQTSLKQDQVQIGTELVETNDPVPTDEHGSPTMDSFFQTEEVDGQGEVIDKNKVKEPKKIIERKPQNTLLTEPYTKDLEKFDDRREKISLPTVTVEELTDIIENIPQVNLGASEEGRNWVGTLNDGLRNLRVDDSGLEALENPDAEFGQSVSHDSGKMRPALQRATVSGGMVVSGEKAILGLRSKTGLGMMVRKPYWHSGIWLTVKTPQEPDILELQRSITTSKVELGRHT